MPYKSDKPRWVIRTTINGKRTRIYFYSKTLAAQYKKCRPLIKAGIYRNV